MKPLTALALMLSASPALADVQSAQIKSLWNHMATVEDLRAVDQIIFEGPTDGPALMGTFEKRDWSDMTPHMIHSKRFYAVMERTCGMAKPECFKVKSIWSNGVKIASWPD